MENKTIDLVKVWELACKNSIYERTKCSGNIVKIDDYNISLPLKRHMTLRVIKGFLAEDIQKAILIFGAISKGVWDTDAIVKLIEMHIYGGEKPVVKEKTKEEIENELSAQAQRIKEDTEYLLNEFTELK